jgi:hypothetical protein
LLYLIGNRPFRSDAPPRFGFIDVVSSHVACDCDPKVEICGLELTRQSDVLFVRPTLRATKAPGHRAEREVEYPIKSTGVG